MRLKLSFLLFFLFSFVWSQTTDTFLTPITSTFKVPAGVTSLGVECWGAGGAGGGVYVLASLFGGGGGGGGAYSKIVAFGVTPATVLNYKVGAGGTGINGDDGTNGEDTYFSTVIANGGIGGKHGNTANGIGGAGGAAAIGSGTFYSGGDGALARTILVTVLASGGGGSSAGTGANGNPAATNFLSSIGGAAVTGGGAGGNGMVVVGGGDGNMGTAPGGGGGGALGLLNTNFKGGNGGNGQIKITYTCPNYSLIIPTTANNVCAEIGTTSLVTLAGGANLPDGDYVVTYNRSQPNATGLTATMSVTGGTGTGTFTAVGLNTTGSSTITITNLTSESCTNSISTNNVVTINVFAATVAGTINTPAAICSGDISGSLTLSNRTGTVLSWEYSVSPFSSWTSVSNTTNTYSPGILTQTTQFRAIVQNGLCSQQTSLPATVTVNPLPILTAANQTVATCVGTGAIINLSGLIANSTSTISYSIDSVVQTPIVGVVADASGAANFTTPNLTLLDNGLVLKIIDVVTTNSAPNCSQAFNQDVTLAVNPEPTLGGAYQFPVNVCVGSPANIILTGLIPNSIFTVDYTIQGIAQTPITGLTASNIGMSNFATPNLILTNNGNTLQITKITITSNSCNCSKTFATNVALSVLPIAAVPVANSGTGATCSSIFANWNSVSHAHDYRLDVATDAGFTSILSGFNDLDVGNVTSFEITGLSSGTYYYRIRARSWCDLITNHSNVISFTISGLPAPVATTGLPNCLGFNANWNTVSDVVFYSISVSTDSGFGTFVTNGNGVVLNNASIGNNTTYAVTGLQSGDTYYYKVWANNACGISASASNVISVVAGSTTTSTWNGLAWLPTSPTVNDNIVFTGNYSSTADLSGCVCTINSGVNVTINSGHTLSIVNSVNNNGGTFVFEDGASLVQTTNAVNTGNIIYKRVSKPMEDFDYTYWSSPVSNQTLFNLSPNTLWDKYFSYTGTGWQQENATSTIMTPGKGYIVRTPKAGLWSNGENVVFPYSQPVDFSGIPNNGVITGENVLAGNFYLVGNPYPSALDADTFLFANPNPNNSAILDGTIYFWTHNTAIQQNGSFYEYTSDDYASYNGVGGIATLPAVSGGAIPSGKIAAGQSFFTLANNNGTILFNNAMRISGNNNQFFKPSKTSKTSVLERHRVWLNMTNTGGAFKQILIGYIQGATNEYDNDFDGLSLDANPFIDFYSINSGNNLVIQGRALPFTDTDTVPLGYRTIIAGNFTIAIDHTDGQLVNQPIYLEDKATNTIHNLKQSSYTFTTNIGVFNNRFVLRYTNNTLGNSDLLETQKEILFWIDNDENIQISSNKEDINSVFIYDISGKLIYHKNTVPTLDFIINDFKIKNQVLIVKVHLTDNRLVTQKMISLK